MPPLCVKICFIFILYSATAAKSLQSCLTLCDPIDGSPGSPVPGVLQARTLKWVAISFSNAWKWKVKVKSLSRVRLLVTPWTAAYQAPPSMGFYRQEYWSGVPLPSLILYSSHSLFSLNNLFPLSPYVIESFRLDKHRNLFKFTNLSLGIYFILLTCDWSLIQVSCFKAELLFLS